MTEFDQKVKFIDARRKTPVMVAIYAAPLKERAVTSPHARAQTNVSTREPSLSMDSGAPALMIHGRTLISHAEPDLSMMTSPPLPTSPADGTAALGPMKDIVGDLAAI
ncbi:hypothetical protein [Oricola sp.]|uniref:hypothetical protein n=1 Tax=Oricola sp. TaxID=1979950 RepID=UPI0025E360D1|nr:hypothetical protein [Oricola sp.]MCI5078329.1 hypothetical protein [Oricola sp.]